MGKVFTKTSSNSGFQTSNAIDTNWDNLETATDRLLSRYADSPNTMESDLDMNDNDILNIGTVNCDALLVDGATVPSLADVVAAQTASETAQTAAETAQTAAETAQAAAEAAAAGVTLPSIGSAGDLLQVNSGATALENTTPTADPTVSTIVKRDAAGRFAAVDPSATDDVATKNYVDTTVAAEEYQLEWVVVYNGSQANATMANVTAAYQGSGLYGFGAASLTHPTMIIQVGDTSANAYHNTISDSPGTADMLIDAMFYNGTTGLFSFAAEAYDAGVRNGGKDQAIAGDVKIWKLVANP